MDLENRELSLRQALFKLVSKLSNSDRSLIGARGAPTSQPNLRLTLASSLLKMKAYCFNSGPIP